MRDFIQMRSAFTVLGAVAVTLVACADAPSGPRPTEPIVKEENVRIGDRRETVLLRARESVRVANGMREFPARTINADVVSGAATITAGKLQADATATEQASSPSAPLRVWIKEGATPGVRLPRQVRLKLPDGRYAVVSRQDAPDGVPAEMRVLVGDQELRWRRTWERREGRHLLRTSVVEAMRDGHVVARQVLDVRVAARPLAATRTKSDAHTLLARWASRFGSIASSVLLPRALQAQQDAGKACNGASKSLAAAWMAFRVTTVTFFATIAFGSGSAILKALGAWTIATAAVEAAEANYIDCYVAAAYAGVPPDNIADPPELEEE